MKLSVALLALLVLACLCDARPGPVWTYEKLAADADLVVIAIATETKDTEKTVIPETQRTDADGKSTADPAIGIETKFRVLVVLKGDKEVKDFVLYHMRQPKPNVGRPNGPQFISFDPKSQQRYLMFLRREADGRFVSVTGQLDAAVGIKGLDARYP